MVTLCRADREAEGLTHDFQRNPFWDHALNKPSDTNGKVCVYCNAPFMPNLQDVDALSQWLAE